MIPLLVGQPEKALLQNGVLFIPQCQAEANMLVPIAETGDAVFSPAIRAGARMIVREIIPRVAIRAVVLAHRAPLPLRQIRTPALPMGHARGAGPQPLFFFSPRGFHAHPLSATPGMHFIASFVEAKLRAAGHFQRLCEYSRKI